MRNFNIDKITYSKPQPLKKYEDSKNKPSLYPEHEYLK